LRFESLEDRRLLATVDTWLDILDDNDGLTSLREAIRDTLAGGTVDFSINPAHGLDDATISLDSDLGEIAFSKSLTIDASMLEGGLTIDAGGGADGEVGNGDGIGIFVMFNPGGTNPSVTLDGLRLTGADVSYSGGAVYSSDVNLTIRNTTITGNSGGAFGGGLFARVTSGAIVLDRSVIEHNSSNVNFGYGSGGGVSLEVNTSTATITESTISGNMALGRESNAGGIAIFAHNDSTVLMERVNVAGNYAADDMGGVGIDNNGSDITIRHSSISNNSAANNNPSETTGGIFIYTSGDGTNTIENSEITENRIIPSSGPGDASNVRGGGLVVRAGSAGSMTTVRNSTISGNQATGAMRVALFDNAFQIAA
jgi:hypothetical protein